METSKNSRPIRIAISGGGLAGATLINALQKYSHLDVHIYESAAEFSERGAAVGLGPNALNALSEMGAELRNTLDSAGGVTVHSSRQSIVCYTISSCLETRHRLTFSAQRIGNG